MEDDTASDLEGVNNRGNRLLVKLQERLEGVLNLENMEGQKKVENKSSYFDPYPTADLII